MKLFNEHGEQIDSVVNYARELGDKTPATLSNHLDKAIAAGEAEVQGQQGRTLYYRVVDLAAARAKYGRQPKPKPVAREEFEALQSELLNKAVENAELVAKIQELEKDLATLRERDIELSLLEAAGVDNWEGYSHAFSGEEI
jgi:hypothetical protein